MLRLLLVCVAQEQNMDRVTLKSAHSLSIYASLLFARICFDPATSCDPSFSSGRKCNVLKSSLEKVERACYTLRVRGSEIPTHMLADVFADQDQDEGFEGDW